VVHSTETALLAVTESLCDVRSSSLSSVLILLDLSAAFDTVNHQILLSTLAELGIAGSVILVHFLPDRSHHQVTWNGSLSRPCILDTGVPQGSVLGPLLFSFYTRSLGSVITPHSFSYHCYADDTQLFLSVSPSDTQITTRILKCLADFLELPFIPGKDCPQMDLHVTIEDIEVSPALTTRNLDVVLDDQLSCTNITSVARFLELLSTTSAGSGPSSHMKQHRSWFKRLSSPASTTATLSWLDSLPPQSNPYNASRTQQCTWYSTNQISPI